MATKVCLRKGLLLLVALLSYHGASGAHKENDTPHDKHGLRGSPGIPGLVPLALGAPLGMPGTPFGSSLGTMTADSMPGMTISFSSAPLGDTDGSLMTIGGMTGGLDEVMDVNDLHAILGGRTGMHGHIPGGTSDGGADPFMGDIMSAMDAAIMAQILPGLQHVQEEPPCKQDEAKLCPRTVFKSALQCLGKYADQVSEKCKKDVKKSLPFNCADELSGGDGCDGVDESIISCLYKRIHGHIGPGGVSVSDACKGSLLVTRSLLHKVNTMKTTVTSISHVNATHVSRTATTRAKRDDPAAAPWMCPDGFTRNDYVPKKSCCTAADSLVHPRGRCVGGGGNWRLHSHAGHGSHGGFQCCAKEESPTDSTTKTEILAKKGIDSAAGSYDTPWGSQSAREFSAQSILVIIALSIMFGIAVRSVAPAAVYIAARRMGVPADILMQPQWKVNSDHQMPPAKEQDKYGTL